LARKCCAKSPRKIAAIDEARPQKIFPAHFVHCVEKMFGSQIQFAPRWIDKESS